MSKENTLYIFVKGLLGKCAYEIYNAKFEPLHHEVIEGLADKGNKLSPYSTDLEAIKAGLKYVKENRGQDGLAEQPSIFIFTTYENNYHIAVGLKNAQKEPLKKFKHDLDTLILDLRRNGKNKDDNVKFYWIPDDFENRIENVKNLLKDIPPTKGLGT